MPARHDQYLVGLGHVAGGSHRPRNLGPGSEYTMLHHGLTIQVPRLSTKRSPVHNLPQKAVDNHNNVFSSLERLAELKKKGIITDKEFKMQKQKLLERI